MNRLFESLGAYNDLIESEKYYLRLWEDQAYPLLFEFTQQLTEAILTNDQVVDIFKRIEDTAVKSGENRTALGKAVDLVKLPSTLMDKIGELAAQSRPVRKFDIAFARAKKRLRQLIGADSNLVAVVDGMGDFAKKHPVAQGFVIGLLTLAAAVVAGPMALPIVGALLRFGNELLKGEKFSRAVGRAVKTGLLGIIAGWGLKEIADMFINTSVVLSELPGYEDISKWTASYAQNGRTIWEINSYVPEELRPKVEKLFKIATDAAWKNDYERANKAFAALTRIIDDPEYKQTMKLALANNDILYTQAVESADKAKKVINAIVAGVQSAIAASTGGGKKTVTETTNTFDIVVTVNGKDSTVKVDASTQHEALRKAIADAQQQGADNITAQLADNNTLLNEAKVSDIFGKISNWSKNLTNKITYDKLMKAWKEAGSPVDSDEFVDFLKSQSIDHTVVDQYLGKTKPKKKDAKKEQPEKEIKFNTGSPEFDQELQKLLAEKGRDTVVKALQSYKAKLTAQTDAYEKFKGQLRRLARTPGTKTLPLNAINKFKAELQSDLAKLVHGDKESGIYAANKIMQYAKAGYNMTDQINLWLATADKEKRIIGEDVAYLDNSDFDTISNMLKEHKLSWADLGLKIVLSESTLSGVFISL